MDTRYRLTGRLESGELAELYRAVTDEHDDVVVKLFHQKTTDPRYARSIAETARVLNPLRHEGILHYLETGLVKGRLAIVREPVDGYMLGQVLQRLNTKEVLLSPEMGLYVVILLAEIVHKAHEAGVVHGAITPGNVFLSKRGEPALCDFGALKALQSVPALKKNFGPRGRNSYRAPELSQGDEASAQSDIYSLGALAYELLTLREAASARASTVSTRRDAIPPPSRLDRRLNSRLDPIILRALDPSPQRRFRSCADFAMALRNFLSVNGGVPTAKDLQSFVAELFPKDVALESQGPVPFGELFVLAEVEGAGVPPLDERSVMVAMRPSFSGGEVDPTAEPQHASPSWDDDTQNVRPDEEPEFDDGTDPGQAGPLERGWEAPPGTSAYAGKPKPAGNTVAPRPGARNPRVKVIEDFSVVEPRPRANEDRDDAEGERSRAPARAVKRAAVVPQARDTLEMKAPALPESPRFDSSELATRPPPRNTEERRLWIDRLRRRKSLVIACGVGVVGLLFLALALTRMSSRPRIPPAPPAGDRAMRPLPPGDPATTAPAKAPPAETVDWYVPPRARGRQTGYVSVTATKSAIVFIDGRRVRTQTPIVRLPVAVGRREIAVQALATDETHRELRTIMGGEEITVHGDFRGGR